ncbi:substrate-binding periplasmic protein [Rhodoferax mekongensis]|uniref:Transporter substrate-binding domain-containing protein n=1 Tax=Rhodoferax mekongensis TaxID=3068341 RepID=A0ABZ0AW89_9BURK|nr:transporter substrate-binding domain-containing protein [Rhodoferax sp. TBRC 17307]WNO03914.1 transporter substrate-binding domain-containing protein [Rhodoferax sp. TBRC 17307]
MSHLQALVLAACVFLGSTFVPQTLHAQTAKVVEISTGDGYPPYVDWRVPTGGIATEVVRNVVLRMGYEPKFATLPWARGYRLTLKGDFIATFPYIRTSGRETEVAFSEPLFGIASHIFVRNNSLLKFEGLGDLAGYSTCNYVGSALPSSVQTLISDGLVKVNEVSSLSTCFKLLELGRVDFVTVNSLAGSSIACEHITGSHQFLISEKPAEVLGLHLVVGLTNAEAKGFLDSFNSELLKFKATKDYQALKTKVSLSMGTDKPVSGFKKIQCSRVVQSQ